MAQEQKDARTLRVNKGLSMTAAAAVVGVAPNTYRVWEIDPSRVSPRVQAKGQAFLERLRAESAEAVA
ncbi:MAG TPA: hypothetical protein VJV79_02810 [Polyangiaceae bacterium]|nr:hypothetical protein [Polyangiaceae bacterium]